MNQTLCSSDKESDLQRITCNSQSKHWINSPIKKNKNVNSVCFDYERFSPVFWTKIGLEFDWVS